MADKLTNRTPSTAAVSPEANAFLARMNAQTASPVHGGGRLIFALDATASREELWGLACQQTTDMFEEAASIGGLNVQLVYYRGLSECRASRWLSKPQQLAGLMERITCRMGHTQIGKVLAHARRETAILKVQALVFVGDAMEEDADTLAKDAAELGRVGVPAFMFQEGNDPVVERNFRAIAEPTHGAYCRFDAGAARQLRDLLRAVATFAVGGVAALEASPNAGATRLLGSLRG
jgi:hypothetical protein